MAETLSTVLPSDVEAETTALLKAADDKDLRIATAESCTGGLLASLLTDVDGFGHVFERGFVVYSMDSKCELLGLDREQVESCNAVSRDVAIAMAEAALERSRADLAVSVTGFAGAAGDGDEEGLVHFGLARRGQTTLHREEHFGDVGRGETRIKAIRTAVEMLRNAI